jgi:hypothetical protein
MAEAILKDAFSKIKQYTYHVSSAGIGALVGHKADAKASQLMMARGGYFQSSCLPVSQESNKINFSISEPKYATKSVTNLIDAGQLERLHHYSRPAYDPVCR